MTTQKHSMEHMQSTLRERPSHEMSEKGNRRDRFFSVRAPSRGRSPSIHTEFMESDWELEDDDIFSGDGETSPRNSLNSSGQPSLTTLSSYDEIQTPRSVRRGSDFLFGAESGKQVEGPRGPHLFWSSVSTRSSQDSKADIWTLSPLTPQHHDRNAFELPVGSVHLTQLPTKKTRSGSFRFSGDELKTQTLAAWTPEMIAQCMLNANVDVSSAERFVENDINGAILMTLKFEDLKELGIASFGMRARIWEQICALKNVRPASPAPGTPIEDEPDCEVRREQRHDMPKPRPSRPRAKMHNVVLPLESVSIVGIEQMIPKLHHCSKREKCKTWRRNQRVVQAFKKDHPFVNLEEGGIMVAGDPGNPETAEALHTDDHMLRPVSDAMPSVIASSDVLGPGELPPLQHLQEANLRGLQSRDPQDNVRQFLQFQHLHGRATGSSEEPPTPPFELLPLEVQLQPPHRGLRALPRLSIPNQAPPVSVRQTAALARPATSSSRRDLCSPVDPDMAPEAPYRFGTPFSEMDVPVTAVPLGPVARETSQSVPPNMNYRHVPNPPSRALSRATARRPSFPVLPALDENSILTPSTQQASKPCNQRVEWPLQQLQKQKANPPPPAPLQAPPRGQYPWTQAHRTTFESAIAPALGTAPTTVLVAKPAASTGRSLSPLGTSTKPGGSDISHQGLMRKRRTKLLRHEWAEHYFTLRGTRLAMHEDAAQTNRTLEYIDIDDYAIACSSLASGKLNAAFKAMHIRRGSADAKDNVAAFSFQLVPQDPVKGWLAAAGASRLKKRESIVAGNGTGEGVNGTGKTHHFAVKSRDDRIDWMRELMLAKALKQKGEGAQVSVNGNMF